MRTKTQTAQADIIRRIDESRVRLLAEMTPEDREYCLSLPADCWRMTEAEKAAVGLATPLMEA